MENRVLFSIGLIIGSVICYLFIRKSKNIEMPVDIQNLAMFLPTALFIGIFNILQKKSFEISLTNILIIAFAALFFSWLGNIASLKALKKAPNPGYSLVISKSYVLMTSILSVWIFNSVLTTKSIIAIIFIVFFSTLIILEKKVNNENKDRSWIWLTFGAFFAWGFLALILKYLIIKGLDSAIILFYLTFFVSILIVFQLIFKNTKIQFKKNYIPIFLCIGIASTFYNLFIVLGYQYAPNPGYINAANAGSIALVTIFSSLLFGDELNIKKVIGVIGVIGSLILLFV
ncbi:MAG: EamA family transporter [Candidatus Gracilibacteria bacterium]|nr:EamA family transporter [Candidatus Gracilibacteria bacterium]